MSTGPDTEEMFLDLRSDPKARRLSALAGGEAYVFITAGPEGTNLDISGIYPSDLPLILQELIDHLVEQLP